MGVADRGMTTGRSRRTAGTLGHTAEATVERQQGKGEHHQRQQECRQRQYDDPDVKGRTAFIGRQFQQHGRQELATEWAGARKNYSEKSLGPRVVREQAEDGDETRLRFPVR